MKNTNTALYCCALFLILVTLVKPRYMEQHTNATLAWDVSGYYLYLPAKFIYNDLYGLKFLTEIIEEYIPSPTPDQAYQTANGNKVMKYSAGMAVQYAPAFFISHAIAKMTEYPTDGFSLPYQAGIHWGSVLYAILGLFFLQKILLKYFNKKTTNWTLIAITLGTNFLNYATFDAANTHAYLFTLIAVLLWATIRFYETYKWKYAILIGASLGLMALTRPTEIIYAMIPIFWGVSNLAAIKSRINILLKHFPKIATAILITGAIGFIQLIYWKSASGNWLEYSYQEQGFSFLKPHFSDVFFSYRKGWLLYTPLMSLALSGFLFLFKNSKKLFPVIFILFLINTWIISAWDIWWYGGAFGQRAFIQSYILLAFPLAAFFEWVFDLNKKSAIPTNLIKYFSTTFIIACMVLNVFQTYQAHWGPFETEAMTKAYYWRIFGKIKNDPFDRLLLDTNEGFNGNKKNIVLIKKEDFENTNDTIYLNKKFATSGIYSSHIYINQEFSAATNISKKENMHEGKWISINANFYSPKMNWDYWRMPQMVVRFENENVPVKEKAIRPFRVMQPNKWMEAGMDIKIPKKEFDNVKIFLWNAGGLDVELYMDDLVVEIFDE